MFRTSEKDEFKFENLYDLYRVGYNFIMQDKKFSGELGLDGIKRMYLVESATKGYFQLKAEQMEVIQ